MEAINGNAHTVKNECNRKCLTYATDFTYNSSKNETATNYNANRQLREGLTVDKNSIRSRNIRRHHEQHDVQRTDYWMTSIRSLTVRAAQENTRLFNDKNHDTAEVKYEAQGKHKSTSRNKVRSIVQPVPV